MHRSRRAIAASVSVSMALASSIAVAHADDSSAILYVNNAASANCTDTGTGAGSAATPFCTIQAAANAAVAGDTVDIAAGTYKEVVNITSSGTASAPIVFEPTGGYVEITDTPKQGPALSFTGASYVKVEGSVGAGQNESQRFGISGVAVNASSDITLDSVEATGNGESVQVTGASSNVTVSRSLLNGMGGGILVGPGGSDDVFSSNEVNSNKNGGISVSGTTNTVITSNTIWGDDVASGVIGVSAGSTGTSIENNIVAPSETFTEAGNGISVDSTSIPGTTADYNVVVPTVRGGSTTDVAPYSWAGVAYATQAAFTSATGQGEHDVIADPQFNSVPYTDTPTAPQINSANSAAPGMLDTDVYGNPCTADPVVPVTGAGSPAYCARGAAQESYTTTTTATATPTGALSVNLNDAVSQTYDLDGDWIGVQQAPTPAVSYVVNWGDGTTSAPIAGSATEVDTAATHTYAKPGTYTITDTAELTDGTTTSTTTTVTTQGSDFSAVTPTRVLDTRKAIGAPIAKIPAGHSVTVKIAGTGSIPANATAVALNVTVTDDTTGGGYLSVGNTGTSSVNYADGQTIANSVITPLTNGSVTIYNVGSGSADIIADVSGYFTQASTADGYAAVPLYRVLNTRTGTGAPEAKVAADSGIPVTVAGIDSIPADVTAVALHITVADTTGGGWVAAEPYGPGVPSTSSVNYNTGAIASNSVIVPVTDGKIELYNGGGKTPVSLIGDISGYFAPDAPDAYVPVTPTRVWDTRQIPGWTLASYSTEDAFLDGENGDEVPSPYPTNAILAANTTVTDTKGGGYLTVYPAGTTNPGTSNLNFTPGQALAGFGLLSTTGPDQNVEVANSSNGSADVLFDVYGYFSNS